MNVGDLHWVDLPAANSYEQRGRRPAVVVQIDRRRLQERIGTVSTQVLNAIFEELGKLTGRIPSPSSP